MTSQSPLLAILWQNTPKRKHETTKGLAKTLKAKHENLDLEPIAETLAQDRLDPTLDTTFCTFYNLGPHSLMMLEF